jgi:hypothetical protein
MGVKQEIEYVAGETKVCDARLGGVAQRLEQRLHKAKSSE